MLEDSLGRLLPGLVDLRRDLHAHPELGGAEVRTTGVVADRLAKAGLDVRLLPGSGLLCDVGEAVGGLRVALRADIDALPVPDLTTGPYRSRVPGVAHACGHDVHTAVVLLAGLALHEAATRGALPGQVRLVFQPAEEITPGGAVDVIAAGGLDGVQQIFAVHCDPRLDVGRVGLRVGPITSASDRVLVRLTGRGGHSSRPFLTQDLVYALGTVVVGVPAVLGRRLDPRAGVNLTWGRVSAGSAANAIPATGEVEGTLRVLDAGTWEHASRLVEQVVRDVAQPFGVDVEVDVVRSVPPVDNDAGAVAVLDAATRAALGDAAVAETEQSLGGEDFGWYLRHVPGALARLGTRAPGGPSFDLHQGDFQADERAVGVGGRLLVETAMRALASPVTHR